MYQKAKNIFHPAEMIIQRENLAIILFCILGNDQIRDSDAIQSIFKTFDIDTR